MINADRMYFSDLPVDPELESLLEHDDLFDTILGEKPDHFSENFDCDDPDDFEWDDC
jgi:hypothetical protein